jgi:hypothetical protein
MAKQQAASKPAVPTVADSEATLARLLAQHEQVATERLRAENETGKHAYGAHAQGDLAAVAELDKIADIIMRHDQTLREIRFIEPLEQGDHWRALSPANTYRQARPKRLYLAIVIPAASSLRRKWSQAEEDWGKEKWR